jgi:hypothetical protein
MRFSCGQISLDLSLEWRDTTDDTGPFTLSKPEGVGALQVSAAIYRTGPKPNASASALASLLSEFAETHNLGEPSEQLQQVGPPTVLGSSYRPDNNTFVRAWYVSDGSNIAKATYVCHPSSVGAELSEAEQIVRSLQFIADGT